MLAESLVFMLCLWLHAKLEVTDSIRTVMSSSLCAEQTWLCGYYLQLMRNMSRAIFQSLFVAAHASIERLGERFSKNETIPHKRPFITQPICASGKPRAL